VAHNESTSNLEDCLRREGFDVVVQKRTYLKEEADFSLMARCLLNHRDAWRRVAERGEASIVVEADFVPVRNFGSCPMPFDPRRHQVAVAWLYAGGPVLYRIEREGIAVGHSSTTVALLMTPAGAAGLVEFAEAELERAKGEYTPWDTYLSHRLRHGSGILTILPFRQYGEHGGLANREHAAHGVRGWHQADRLLGRLAFLPEYAGGSRIRYRLVRLRASIRGIARLLSFRYLELGAFARSNQRARLLRFAIARWLW